MLESPCVPGLHERTFGPKACKFGRLQLPGQQCRGLGDMCIRTLGFLAARTGSISRRRRAFTRCMPESLGAPGLRKRTPPTRSLFASFAGCRQDNSGQAWGTRASGLNVGLVGCQDRLDLEEAAGLQRKRRPSLVSLRWSQKPNGLWTTAS